MCVETLQRVQRPSEMTGVIYGPSSRTASRKPVKLVTRDCSNYRVQHRARRSGVALRTFSPTHNNILTIDAVFVY